LVLEGEFLQVPSRSTGRWVAVALVACLVFGLGAVLGAAKGPAWVRRSAPAARAELVTPSNSPAELRRGSAILAASKSGAVRVLLPDNPTLNKTEVIVVDVWSFAASEGVMEVRYDLSGPGLEAAGIATQSAIPGRYKVSLDFVAVGEHHLDLDIGGTAVSVALQVVDDEPRS